MEVKVMTLGDLLELLRTMEPCGKCPGCLAKMERQEQEITDAIIEGEGRLRDLRQERRTLREKIAVVTLGNAQANYDNVSDETWYQRGLAFGKLGTVSDETHPGFQRGYSDGLAWTEEHGREASKDASGATLPTDEQAVEAKSANHPESDYLHGRAMAMEGRELSMNAEVSERFLDGYDDGVRELKKLPDVMTDPSTAE